MTESTSTRTAEEVDCSGQFTVRAWLEGPLHVVAVSGDLDLTSRAAALDACALIEHQDVVVDLSALRFMDCAGYSAFVTATTTLGGRGGSMVFRDPTGEPRRLLALVEQVGGLCAPVRPSNFHVSPPTTRA